MIVLAGFRPQKHPVSADALNTKKLTAAPTRAATGKLAVDVHVNPQT